MYSHVAEGQQQGTTDPDNNQFPHHRQSRPAKEKEKQKNYIWLFCKRSLVSLMLLKKTLLGPIKDSFDSGKFFKY